jgi:quinol monooxygenase YgiN
VSVYIRARFEVRPGAEKEFEKAALALAAAAAAEPGTVSYRWFSLPGSATRFSVEEYVDSAAVMTHMDAVADLLATADESAEMVLVELYGPIRPDLRAVMDSNPRATILPDYPAA